MTARNALERILSRAQLEVAPGRCLHEHHRRASCRLCVDNCSANAIGLSGRPEVDYSRCHCCGVCVNLCPTGVFQLLEPSYEGLVTQAKGRKIVEFGCAERLSDDAIIPVPCLGYLNEAVLVAVIAGGGADRTGASEIRLDISHCEGCSFQGGLTVAIETMRRTNRLLFMFGLPNRVTAQSSNRGDRSRSAKRSDNSDDRRFSRREFLRYLGRGTKNVAGDAAAPAIERHPGLTTSRLPEKRRMLLDHLSQIEAPPTGLVNSDGVPFARVTVSDDCDGCGICVSFCPTGALSWHDDADRRALTFVAADCLACGLCRELCPRDDLSLEPSVRPGDIVARTVTTLKQYDAGVCSTCQQRYAPANPQNLCRACGKKDGLRRWFIKS